VLKFDEVKFQREMPQAFIPSNGKFDAEYLCKDPTFLRSKTDSDWI